MTKSEVILFACVSSGYGVRDREGKSWTVGTVWTKKKTTKDFEENLNERVVVIPVTLD